MYKFSNILDKAGFQDERKYFFLFLLSKAIYRPHSPTTNTKVLTLNLGRETKDTVVAYCFCVSCLNHSSLTKMIQVLLAVCVVLA
jgi:hypothetical protein